MDEEILQGRDETIDRYEVQLGNQLDYVFGNFIFGISDDPRDIALDTLMVLLLDEGGAFNRAVQSMPFRARAEHVAGLVKEAPDSFTKGLGDVQENLVKSAITKVTGVVGNLAAKAQIMAASGRVEGFRATAHEFFASEMRTLVDIFQNTLLMWERLVLDKIAENFKNEPKFLYMGPQDKRNREFCREIVNTPPRTRAEIELLNEHPALHYYVPPNVFVMCGGHNCRHLWVPVAQ